MNDRLGSPRWVNTSRHLRQAQLRGGGEDYWQARQGGNVMADKTPKKSAKIAKKAAAKRVLRSRPSSQAATLSWSSTRSTRT